MQKPRIVQRFGIFAGVLYLIGFIFPVIIPFGDMGIIFPNIQMLVEPELPFSAKLYLLFPLAGAMLCFVALAQGKPVTRAILFLIAGYVPWLLELVIAADMLADSSFGFGGIGRSLLNSSSLVSYMLSFGIMALVVGAYTGSAYKGNKVAPYLALSGGGLVALGLLLPVEMGRNAFNLLIAPFQALFETPLVGIALLVLLGVLLPACVFGILWGIKHKEGVDHSSRIRRLLSFGFFWAAIMLFVTVFAQFADRIVDIGVLPMVLTIYIKGFGMLVAPFLAKCLGFIELLGHLGGSDSGSGGDAVKLNPEPITGPNPVEQPGQTPF